MPIIGSLRPHFSPSLLSNIKDNLAIGDVNQFFLKSEDMSEDLEHTGNLFMQNQKGIWSVFQNLN